MSRLANWRGRYAQPEFWKRLAQALPHRIKSLDWFTLLVIPVLVLFRLRNSSDFAKELSVSRLPEFLGVLLFVVFCLIWAAIRMRPRPEPARAMLMVTLVSLLSGLSLWFGIASSSSQSDQAEQPNIELKSLRYANEYLWLVGSETEPCIEGGIAMYNKGDSKVDITVPIFVLSGFVERNSPIHDRAVPDERISIARNGNHTLKYSLCASHLGVKPEQFGDLFEGNGIEVVVYMDLSYSSENGARRHMTSAEFRVGRQRTQTIRHTMY